MASFHEIFFQFSTLIIYFIFLLRQYLHYLILTHLFQNLSFLRLQLIIVSLKLSIFRIFSLVLLSHVLKLAEHLTIALTQLLHILTVLLQYLIQSFYFLILSELHHEHLFVCHEVLYRACVHRLDAILEVFHLKFGQGDDF